MVCQYCDGLVEWVGQLTNLYETRCLRCGAINSQVRESEEEGEE